MYFITVIIYLLLKQEMFCHVIYSRYWNLIILGFVFCTVFWLPLMFRISPFIFHFGHSLLWYSFLMYYERTRSFLKEHEESKCEACLQIASSPCYLWITKWEHLTSKHIWLLLQNQKIDGLFPPNRLKNMLYYE